MTTYQLRITENFEQWSIKLDKVIRRKLANRIERVKEGNLGDHKIIDVDLIELRCFFGGGIRVYLTIRGQ